MSKSTKIHIRKTAALLLALSLLCALLPAAYAQDLSGVKVRSSVLDSGTITADGMVRVYLSSITNQTVLNLKIGGGYSIGTTGETLSDGTNVTVGFSTSSGAITLSFNGRTMNMGTQVTLRRLGSSSAHHLKISQAKESANPYPGDLELRAVYGSNGYQLYPIVHVYMENYLYGVLPYEMGNSSNIEALKAQAVAARTYTVRMMKSRASGMYDVKDTTSDQVYRGTPSGNANCVAAIDATKGIVLMFGSSYITTYYSASNGGQTEASRTGTNYAYMQVKDDPFDYANPSSTVKKKTVYTNLQSSSNNAQLISLLKSKAIAKLNQNGYGANYSNVSLGTLYGIVPHTPMYASPSRLYTKMDFQFSVSVGGSSTTVTVTCDIFGELESILSLGIQSASNELWSVASGSGYFEIQTRRYGHGMGMSQRGAMYMAKLGYTYDQILGFYFEGCIRVRHSFTHTFLTPSGNEQVNVENPADDQENQTSACYATVRLANAGSSLAIRSAKSSNASVVGSAANGARVDVLFSDGSWCLIRFGEIRGYVPVSALTITGTPDGMDIGATSILGFSTVTASDFLNLRAGESTSAQILGTAPAGAVLTVFSRSGNWARVQYNALTAYVNTGYLSPITQTYPQQDLSSGTNRAIVTTKDGGGVNLRSSASTSAQIIASFPSGTEVTVLSDDGSWSYVNILGTTGYMMSAYLSKPDEFPEVEEDLPAEDEMEDVLWATVTTQSGGLNMRALPQTGSLILTTLPRNAEVIVTGRGDAWSSVRYNGLNGYVMTRYLTFAGEGADTPAAPSYSDTATVVTPGGTLNLRIAPQTGSEILFTIPQGAQVTVHSYAADWCHVTYLGISGYVMTTFLSFENSNGNASIPEMKPETVRHAVVNTVSGSLNLRLEPSAMAAVIAWIPQYSRVDVLEYGEQWCLTSWQGKTGYVMTSFLQFVMDEPQHPEKEETPSQTVGQTAYVYTSSGSLNLRSEPSGAAQILCAIPRLAAVNVLAYGDVWCAISYGMETGYVMTRYLNFTKPQEAEKRDETRTQWVNTTEGSLNLRSEPSSSTMLLAAIPQYAQVTSYGSDGNWSYVNYQGVCGYVMTRYLADGTPPGSDFFNPPDTTVGEFDITMRLPEQATYAITYEEGGLPLWPSCEEYGAPVGMIAPYEMVEIVLMGERWCCVQYQGMQGYCKTEWLSVMQ